MNTFNEKNFAESYVEDLSILDNYSAEERQAATGQIGFAFTDQLVEGKHYNKQTGWEEGEDVYVFAPAEQFSRFLVGGEEYRTIFAKGTVRSTYDADSDNEVGVCRSEGGQWHYVNVEHLLTIHPVAFLLAKKEAEQGITRTQGSNTSSTKTSSDTKKDNLMKPLVHCPATLVHKVTFIYKAEEGDDKGAEASTFTATQITSWKGLQKLSEKIPQWVEYEQSPKTKTETFTVLSKNTVRVYVENLAGIIMYKVNGEVTSVPFDDSYKLTITGGLKKPTVQTSPKGPKKPSKKVNNPNYWAEKAVLDKAEKQSMEQSAAGVGTP